MTCVMVMAGGTGGHVMPALAVARHLRDNGVEVFWMGTPEGLESRLVPEAGFELEGVPIKGMRQSGLKRRLMMPFMLLWAMLKAGRIMRRRRPDAILGMGGFVAGPGGLVAALTRRPLVVHEQNAIAGMTNRWLARFARRVLTGFPVAEGIEKFHWVGNPVRREIFAIPSPDKRLADRSGPMRLLVIGGSQGASVFNKHLPELLGRKRHLELDVWHQCGKEPAGEIGDRYLEAGISCEVNGFIDDMARAYEWCDVVICRAGAMTVSEVCAAGVVAFFVPYPHAVNDHQTSNASYLRSRSAAFVVQQDEFLKGEWLEALARLQQDRDRLTGIAMAARKLARPEATDLVALVCQEVMHA